MRRGLSVLADYVNLCGESPLWDVQQQCLYWTDALGARFFRYQWNSNVHQCVKQGIEINSVALQEDGGFVIANNFGIWIWDGGDSLKLIAEEFEGAKCRVNDCIADPRGRLIAGSNFYDPSVDYPFGKLFCVYSSGVIDILDEGFHLANGLGFSPDCNTLYFTDSIARCILAYDYDVEMGAAKNRRTLVKVPRAEGIPDGLTIDREGFLWSAQWYGGCVVRYDPDGKVERRLMIPAKQPSSIAFGGPELTDIFITSANSPDPSPAMPIGYDPNSGYQGGALFHTNLGIPGKREFLTKIAARR
jgi:D-xylonolactonase